MTKSEHRAVHKAWTALICAEGLLEAGVERTEREESEVKIERYRLNDEVFRIKKAIVELENYL